ARRNAADECVFSDPPRFVLTAVIHPCNRINCLRASQEFTTRGYEPAYRGLIREVRFALRKNFPYGLGDRMKIGSGSFGVVSARSWLRSLGMLLALATILCGRAGAQATSSVTGLVTDPSGAAVVGAPVTLTAPDNAF